ncbi:M23 family metallopeptidase [Staphylococcus gallinarum]|nr:M23 family metallopeptidase [Staphylococcus gallinarum]MCD8827538.1 M23 family metallopeptidase [Staphylococcus gallinarum]
MNNVSNDIINNVEKKDYKRLYNFFDDNLKNNIKKRTVKKALNSYLKRNTEHYLYKKIDLQFSTQYVFFDKSYQRGMSFTLNSDNLIEYILFKAFNIEDNGKYTQLQYSMPIDKTWSVVWGGHNELLNYHYPYINQRYAYDLVIRKDGRSYKGNGGDNNDYFAFNQKIFSPQEGVVVDIKNNERDNIPGEMTKEKPLGNYVVIRHMENEYSLIAHFKNQSITVVPGDIVKKGQLLGKCGNSGNSTEPHIHFQLMDSPTLFNDCHSLKIHFSNEDIPIQGDLINWNS